MKKLLLFCLLLNLSAVQNSYALKDFAGKDGNLAVSLSESWQSAETFEPQVVLMARSGGSEIKFIKEDDELDDYYLKQKLEENMQAMRLNGASFDQVRTLALLHGFKAYYSVYNIGNDIGCLAVFTYKGNSFSFNGSGITHAQCQSVLSTARRPGEELPKPAPKPKAKPKPKPVKETVPENTEYLAELPVSSAGEENVGENGTAAAVPSQSSAPALSASDKGGETALSVSAGTAAARNAAEHSVPKQQAEVKDLAPADQSEGLLGGIVKKFNEKKPGSEIKSVRNPLPLHIWLYLIVAWLFVVLYALSKNGGYRNPKLPPPPKDNVAPDFSYPLLLNEVRGGGKHGYIMVNRLKHNMSVSCVSSSSSLYYMSALYGAVVFNILWSLAAFLGYGYIVTQYCSMVPYGIYLAYAPEAVFIIPLLIGLFHRKKSLSIEVFNKQMSCVAKVRSCPKDVKGYAAVYNGKDELAARIVKNAKKTDRWDFVSGNEVKFSITESIPQLYSLVKFSGNLGGKIRMRYSMYKEDKLIGYIFLDPMSYSRFQIHVAYDDFRVAPPVQLMASVLYIMNTRNGHTLPWF